MWFKTVQGLTPAEVEELNRRMAAAVLIQAIEDGTGRDVMAAIKETILASYMAEREARRQAFTKKINPPV